MSTIRTVLAGVFFVLSYAMDKSVVSRWAMKQARDVLADAWLEQQIKEQIKERMER